MPQRPPQHRPISARAFHKLHEAGCFVIPNPWDVGKKSARYLQGLGFKGARHHKLRIRRGSHGPSGRRHVARPGVLDHLTDMVEATDLPIKRRLRKRFFRARMPGRQVAESVRLAVESGRRGSVDRGFDRRRISAALRKVDTAHRQGFARRARRIDKAGGDTLPWSGRAEGIPSRARPDIRAHRPPAQSLCERGAADCLYAPGNPHTGAHWRGGRRRGRPKARETCFMGWAGKSHHAGDSRASAYAASASAAALRPFRLGRLHARRQADRRTGQIRRFRRRGVGARSSTSFFQHGNLDHLVAVVANLLLRRPPVAAASRQENETPAWGASVRVHHSKPCGGPK